MTAAAKLLSSPGFAGLDVKAVPEYYHELPEGSYSREREFFERSVSAAWMAHLTGKGVSAPSIVAEDPQLPVEKVRLLMATPRFRQAVKDRGIPPAEMNHLTTSMMAVLHILGDHSLNLTTRQRITRLGVDWNEYQGWLDYRPFRDAHRELMKRALAVGIEVGDRVLAQRIEAGDLAAIKYANEMSGKYIPGAQAQTSVAYVLSAVLSTLKRNITDPELLGRVSGELLALATGNGIPAPLVLEATVVEPDVDYDEHEPRHDLSGPGDERAV